ncbi:S1C family serine protease [Paenibacillus septentrionalis]|uniref:S1C family serine protease n=1 Tax=Paenibacillus septentrionalis TaxID=429342 RepID=A0ABW1V3P9_9BACL
MNWRAVLVFLGILLMLGGGFVTYFELKEMIPRQLKGAPLLAVGEKTKSLKDIIFETQKYVVMIETDSGNQGSGFLYNDKGDLITNAHVVSGVRHVRVKTADARELVGEVIGISTEIDVAVVRVPELAGHDSLNLVKYEKASVGDEVLSIGSPLGLHNTVTTGMISGVGRSLLISPYTYNDLYQISTPISHGNSGGPLVDTTTGSVLGINSAGLENSSIGFSIPIVNVLPLIEGWSLEPMTMLPGISLTDGEQTLVEDKQPLDQMASYLVKHFYDAINIGDYVYAYTLLGVDWQESTSYVKFRDSLIHLRNISIDDEHISLTDDEAMVTVVISADERVDGSYKFVKQQITFRVGYDDDQLKLLNSKSKYLQ